MADPVDDLGLPEFQRMWRQKNGDLTTDAAGRTILHGLTHEESRRYLAHEARRLTGPLPSGKDRVRIDQLRERHQVTRFQAMAAEQILKAEKRGKGRPDR
jgi:hypothetical protein